jgi:hypothetical protein
MRHTNLVSREDYGRWMSTFREDDTGVQRSFDDLASGVASGTISRRRALKLAGASVLGAAGLLGVANPAQAATTCPRRGAGCLRECKNTRKTRKLCYCIRTASGSRRCVYPCCSFRPCGQCRSGEVCMRSNCCGSEPTCVTPCDRRRPNYCGGGGGAAARQSTGSAVWS